VKIRCGDSCRLVLLECRCLLRGDFSPSGSESNRQKELRNAG
jgi:hypothetical protein